MILYLICSLNKKEEIEIVLYLTAQSSMQLNMHNVIIMNNINIIFC